MLMLMLVCGLAVNAIAQGELVSQKVFSPDEMTKLWEKFGGDEDWKLLTGEVRGRKFKRYEVKEGSWGFSGTVVDEKGKKVPVMFCAYDFYNPNEKEGQGCSMVWRQVGDQIYKAYLVFPVGEKSMDKALLLSEEWFSSGGKIQKAHSFGRCFRNCIGGNTASVVLEGPFGFKTLVKADCKNSCLAGVAICGGVTAILSVASGGLGVPATIAVFFGCAGVACAPCFAACALGCM